MIIEQSPSGEMTQELDTYFQRMWRNVGTGIDEATNVIQIREIPDRPVEGVLYYLLFDLDIGNATKGYWIWIKDETDPDLGYWEKLVVGSELNALEERVAALEAP